MVQDRSYNGRSIIKSYIIYRSAPFLMTSNDPNSDFKVTPIFDTEYLSNGRR